MGEGGTVNHLHRKALKMKTMTPEQLKTALSQVDRSEIANVTLETNVKLLKKGRDSKEPCPFGKVTKRSRLNVMFGSDYERGVNNQRSREDLDQNFEAGNTWGDRTDDKVLTIKGEQYYANMRVLDTHEVEYFADGKPISEEEVRQFAPKKSKPKNQGTEKPVIWTKPKVFPECSFREVRVSGEEIIIEESK